MTGLVRVMGNLGVLVFWIFLALYFTAHGLVTPDWPGKLACVTGVAAGTGAWFLGLSWAVSLGHGKLSDKTLLRMEHYSGAFLVILAIIQGGIILLMVQKAAGRSDVKQLSLGRAKPEQCLNNVLPFVLEGA
jgi:hypothetical protein